MAKEGFKRKLAAIISTKAKRYSRLMYDPEEPMLHNLTPYHTYKIDLSQQD